MSYTYNEKHEKLMEEEQLPSEKHEKLMEEFLNERLPLEKHEKLTVHEVYEEYNEYDDNTDIFVTYHIDHEISLGIYERTTSSVVVNIKEFERWLSSFSPKEEKVDEYEDSLRQTGRSTRLADAYIQELFANGEIQVKDHIDKLNCHKELYVKIRRRLVTEHKHRSIWFDNVNFKITLLS